MQVSYAISAMQVITVDIQTGDRHVRETAPAPDLAPGTPPRAQGAIPLKRSLQKRLAARKAMDVIAEGAALGTPAGSERPYFKVGIAACSRLFGLLYVFSISLRADVWASHPAEGDMESRAA